MNRNEPDKSFTTAPKNHRRAGHSPVRDRCLEFVGVLKTYGYNRQVPLDLAKELFQRELQIMDRVSLTAYFGSQEQRTIKKIQRLARYASGTVSFKSIELSQNVARRRGYFELLGLAAYERRGHTWFMILIPASLVPEIRPIGAQRCEEAQNESIDRISLTSQSTEQISRGWREMNCKGGSSPTRETETNNNIQDEREKLSLEELCLKAYQRHNESDRQEATA